MLDATKLTPAMRALLRGYRTTLVVSDRREISGDNLFGFYFDSGPPRTLEGGHGVEVRRGRLEPPLRQR